VCAALRGSFAGDQGLWGNSIFALATPNIYIYICAKQEGKMAERTMGK